MDKDLYKRIVQEELQNVKGMNEGNIMLKSEELANAFHKATAESDSEGFYQK